MNILVLGGTGYLGSKMILALYNNKHSVIAVKREKSDISRTSEINDKVLWIDSSLETIKKIVDVHQIDFVVNTVCNYGRCEILYDSILEANLEYPLDVFNILIHNGVKNILTIGTSLPRDFNMYSFSKSMVAEVGQFLNIKHGVNFYNIQLEMFYGSDEPENRFVPSVIRKMLRGADVETTMGTQRRDIIAANDVINALIRIIEANPKGYFDIPIGSGVAPTISELIDYIYFQTGAKATVIKGAIPMRPDEPDCVANLEVIKSIIGDWEPISWEKGIFNMINEIRVQEEI